MDNNLREAHQLDCYEIKEINSNGAAKESITYVL